MDAQEAAKNAEREAAAERADAAGAAGVVEEGPAAGGLASGGGAEGGMRHSGDFTLEIRAGCIRVRRPKRGMRDPSANDLAANNAIMMPVIRDDFAKGTTVEEGARQAGRWCDKQIHEETRGPIDPEWEEGEVERPLAEPGVSVPVLSNGKPSFQSLTAHVPPPIKIHKKAYYSTGGWHTVKAMFKHLCRLFDHLIIPIIKKCGRNTAGKVAWFIDSSDPLT